jgi:hypothetical protein
MSEWIKRLAGKYSEVNENKKAALQKKLAKSAQSSEKGKAAVTLPKAPFKIPEEIAATERTAFMGAAAAAHKAGKSHFNFAGKKHKVTMQKDTAKAIADDVEEAYNEPQGQAKRMASPLQKARMDKEKADRDRDGKLIKSKMSTPSLRRKSHTSEETIDEISMDKAKSAYYKRKSQAQGAAAQGSMDYAKKQMAKARKTKAYIDRRESVEEAVDIAMHKKAAADHAAKAKPVGNKWPKGADKHDNAAKAHQHVIDMHKKFGPDHSGTKDAVTVAKNASNRAAGDSYKTALKKSGMKEENLDEISVGKLMKYGKAAAKDIEKNRNTVKTALDQPASPKKADAGLKSMKTLRKRSKGSDMYVNKMTGRSKVKPTAEAYENIKKATHQGKQDPQGVGLSPSAKAQLANKTPTPEPVDEPKVDAKNFQSFRKSLKVSKKRPGDNDKGDKNVVK